MTAKKRVYDLAKTYGMSGQELASKLRDLGFQVKSHMSALSEFEVLEIQARLEAYGIVGEAAPTDSTDTVGGLKIKRKKRKKPAPEEEPKPAALEAEAPTSEDEASVAASAAPEPEPLEAEPEPSPAGAASAEAPVEEEPAPVEAPSMEASEPELVAEPRGAEAPAPASAETDAPTQEAHEPGPPLQVGEPEEEPSDAEPVVPAAARVVEAAPKEAPPETAPGAAAGAGGTETTTESKEEGASVVRPSAKRRTGKVVGFIDPSQFQSAPVRRPVSRRLRSSDDVVPDVRPTFGRDRASGQVRGDQTRGSMTAQELREREAGRFLRRRRMQQTGGPGGRRGGGPRPSGFESPYADHVVPIESPISIKKLANTLAVKENQVLRIAFQQLGFGININSLIDDDTAMLLAGEFQVDLDIKEEVAAEEALLKELEEKRSGIDAGNLVSRPPTVAFLGHVDHGKTTLIDSFRTSRIATGESGGITQHIGAYQVETRSGHTITIVDTPGHAAFTAMRARGAQAVDVVVLVVAADDGVKPQTEEALNHAKAARVPIVVALNKMDKPDANPERVRNELAGMGLTPEAWGGETAMLEVSGLKGEGLEELLERVFLESEVLELRCNPDGPATGVVLEAEIQQGKGKVAHLLLQDGVLRRGDIILAGGGYGKVRSIHDDRGKQIKEARPSMPVEVTGLNELPTVGDRFHVVESLDSAQEVAEERARSIRLKAQVDKQPARNQNIFEAVAEQEKTTIDLIVKADVQGSVEVLKQQLSELKHDEVDVKVIHAGVGAVQESDVDLAVTSNALIVAFHTSAQSRVRQAAERAGIEIKVYEVIYELLDDVRALMEGELAPELREEVTGHAEIRRIFKSSKIGNIGGCFVLDGKLNRNSRIRLLRDERVIHTGSIGTLRREKDDAKEVREGFECGIVLKGYNNIQEGDVIEAYSVKEYKRTL